MTKPHVLLTNDDGIESPGIRSLYEALSEVADVTVVAPATDQSAIGRAISFEVDVEERELGYSISGTPSDCVVAGLGTLAEDADLVVAGCNEGANLGSYVLGRSGTVSAAVEAAFFGVPAMAVSLYVPPRDDPDAFEEIVSEPESYLEARRAARYLVEEGYDDGVFRTADYLNVNVPLPSEEPASMTVTRPSTVYEMGAVRDGGTISLDDHVWERLGSGEIPGSEGTDRRAVVDDRISVSPLIAPHTLSNARAVDEAVDAYPDGVDL